MSASKLLIAAILLLMLSGCGEEKAVPVTDETAATTHEAYEKGHIDTH